MGAHEVKRRLGKAQVGASFVGLAIAIWAHLVALSGRDPRVGFRWIWIVQLLLLCLLLPIALAVFRGRTLRELFHPPRWMRLTIFWLLTYYGVHFYLFVFVAAEHLTSVATWRMFTAGWILLFAFAAAFYNAAAKHERITK